MCGDQAGILDEMMNDMMDSTMDEDIEEETDAEVDKVSRPSPPCPPSLKRLSDISVLWFGLEMSYPAAMLT